MEEARNEQVGVESTAAMGQFAIAFGTRFPGRRDEYSSDDENGFCVARLRQAEVNSSSGEVGDTADGTVPGGYPAHSYIRPGRAPCPPVLRAP
jgi:hypothetical protein